MKLIFEKSREGRELGVLMESDVPVVTLDESLTRKSTLLLPKVSETELSRHYTELSKRVYGVNCGFYPLGSCTMKYNPKVNDEAAKLEGFTEIHPLQPESTIQGCLELLYKTEQYLCEITGMEAVTFQPAAGAHGEFTGLLLIRKYHEKRLDLKRDKIIVPDSAHGTNPASAAMVGYTVINIPSDKEGYVDLEALKAVLGDDTAGLMLTNPNTVGLFDPNILEITRLVHEAGGLNYYDGANMNAIMGICRPGDMGFDVIHLNLHKTFSTPHGGGGPGSGPVGCKGFLRDYLPQQQVVKTETGYQYAQDTEDSIGRVKEFHGNFLVIVRAYTYLLTLGAEGLKKASCNAVLNANYMMEKLKDSYDMAYQGPCMHEFVMSLERLKQEKGVSAMDIAKGLLDNGIHPPTMYFPLIVHEALMIEPTETESKETLNHAVELLLSLYEKAIQTPESLHEAPVMAPVRRLDEVEAARKPVLKYQGGYNGETV